MAGVAVATKAPHPDEVIKTSSMSCASIEDPKVVSSMIAAFVTCVFVFVMVAVF